ncbi:MAG: DUF4351 domain-containing protein, partial [Planctomycetia bacterium]|nr:DUF4351 domain-containing protein [Planctomycetia bacterium]
VQADKLYRIDGPQPSILHLELEANPRLGIPRELMRYNTLVDHQHGLPVESVLVLLRPKALASDQTERYDRIGATGRPIASFHYHIVKVWERSVDDWLNAGLGLAPLAMLTDEASTDLEQTLGRFRDRLRSDGVTCRLSDTLFVASSVLCGLRYNYRQIVEMYRRLNMLMEESSVYQWIVQQGKSAGLKEGKSLGLQEGKSLGLQEGRMVEARNLVLRQATRRFGEPAPASIAKLNAIADLNRLESLADKVLVATNWDEFLADA